MGPVLVLESRVMQPLMGEGAVLMKLTQRTAQFALLHRGLGRGQQA